MDKLNILHLSDLHFGSERNRSITAYAQRENILNELIKFISQEIQKDLKPNIIIISGDIAWSGKEQDYRRAEKWIKNLAESLELDTNRIILCCGNHDIDREEAKELPIPKNAKNADEYLDMENISKFTRPFTEYIRSCERLKLQELTIGQQKNYLIGKIDIEDLRFVVLNSAWFYRENNTRNLWIGLPHLQLMKSKKQLNGGEKLTIAILHHPAKELNEAETCPYEGRLCTYNYLAKNVDIILSGHTHGVAALDSDIKYNEVPLIIGGASYVNEGYRNNFSILQYKKQSETIARHVYEYNPSRGEWQADKKIDIQIPHKISRKVNGCNDLKQIINENSEKYSNGGDYIHNNISLKHLDSPYNNQSLNLDNFDVYSYLFSKMSYFNNKPIENNVFEKIYQKFCCNAIKSLEIKGQNGVGKTTFLSVFYWSQYKKWCDNNSELFPIYINIKKYDYLLSNNKSIENENDIRECIQNDFQTIKEKITDMRVKGVIFILDSYDGFGLINQCISIIEEFISNNELENNENKRVDLKKIIGYSISNYSTIENYKNSSNILEIKALDLNHKEVHNYIRAFAKISIFNIKSYLLEEILDNINNLDYITLDFFTLKLIFYTYNEKKELTDIITMLKFSCLSNLNSIIMPNEEELFNTSMLAFNHFIKREDVKKSTLLNEKKWGLINSHPTMTSYLIAYYIIYVLKNEIEEKYQILNYVYPYSVNRFCKYMIDSDIKVQNSLINFTNKILKDNREIIDTCANLAYYIGRIENKDEVNEILQNMIYKIQKYDAIYSDPVKKQFILRSAYVSLIYRGYVEELENYIKLLVENEDARIINVNFHVIYYEEIPFDTEEFYENLVKREIGYRKIFERLLFKVEDNLEGFTRTDTIFQLNLYTLCSILTITNDVQFKNYAISKIKEKDLIKRVKGKKSALVGILKDYLIWFEDYISYKNRMEIRLLEKLYNLKKIERAGWVERKIKGKIESVASHSYFTSIQAMLFLLDDSKTYSKEKVIKMLLLHDIAEAYTGDIISPAKTKNDMRIEKEWIKYIAMHNNLQNYHGLWCIEELYEEFINKKTYESKLANDFDRLDLVMQLCIYQHIDNQQIVDYNEWCRDIRNNMLTKEGEIIFNFIEKYFLSNSQNERNIYIYTVDKYIYKAINKSISKNNYFYVKDSINDLRNEIKYIAVAIDDGDFIQVKELIQSSYKAKKIDYKFSFEGKQAYDSKIINKMDILDEHRLYARKEFDELLSSIKPCTAGM